MSTWDDAPTPEIPGWQQIQSDLHGQVWRRVEPPTVDAGEGSHRSWWRFVMGLACMGIAYEAAAITYQGYMPAWMAGLFVAVAAVALWLLEVVL